MADSTFGSPVPAEGQAVGYKDPDGNLSPANVSLNGNLISEVSNFPETQNIIGSVSVNNFPVVQPVNGTVTVNQGTAAALTAPWPAVLVDPAGNSLAVSDGSAVSANTRELLSAGLDYLTGLVHGIWTSPQGQVNIAGGNWVSTINTTTVILSASATWNASSYENVLPFNALKIRVVTDRDGTLTVSWLNGSNARTKSYPIIGSATVATIVSVPTEARQVKLSYTNGSIAQTVFELYTINSPFPVSTPVVPPVGNTLSPANSTNTPLAVSGSWFGVAENVVPYSQVKIRITVDQPGWMSVSWGNPGQTQSKSYDVQATGATDAIFTLPVEAETFKVSFSNTSATAQTVFELHTTYMIYPTGAIQRDGQKRNWTGPGVDMLTPVGYVYSEGAPTITEPDTWAAPRITPRRALHVHVRDVNGVAMGDALTGLYVNQQCVGGSTIDQTSGTQNMSLGNKNGKTNFLQTGTLVTSAVTADQLVLTHTVAGTKQGYIQGFTLSAQRDAFSSTGAILGDISVEISNVKVFTERLLNSSDARTDRVEMTFGEPIWVAAGATIRIICTPKDATSTRWRGNLLGYEK